MAGSREALFAAGSDKVDEGGRLFFQVGAARPEVPLAFLIEHPHRVGNREPGNVHHVHVQEVDERHQMILSQPRAAHADRDAAEGCGLGGQDLRLGFADRPREPVDEVFQYAREKVIILWSKEPEPIGGFHLSSDAFDRLRRREFNVLVHVGDILIFKNFEISLTLEDFFGYQRQPAIIGFSAKRTDDCNDFDLVHSSYRIFVFCFLCSGSGVQEFRRRSAAHSTWLERTE